MELIEGFRLSPQQQRLWQLRRDHPDSNAQCSILIEGPLRPAALRESLWRLVSRHEVLRTAFRLLPGMDAPLQVIVEQPPVELREVECGASVEELSRLSRGERGHEFAFESGEVLRAALTGLGGARHLLTLTLPALCADAASLVNIFRELAQHYAACTGDELLEDEAVQFVQFSEWQHELLESEEAAAGREFWELEGLMIPPPLRLPYESGDAAGAAAYRPESVSAEVEDGAARRIVELAVQESSTTAAVLLACWQSLLWRLTDEPVSSVEVALDGRKYEEMQGALGLYSRWLPIQSNLNESTTFRDVLGKATDDINTAYSKQEFYAPKQIQQSPTAGGQAASLPIGFDYEEWPEAVRAGGLGWSLDSLSACAEPFKLRLSASSSASGLRLSFHYDAARLDRQAVSRLAQQYLTLLRSAASTPDAPLATLPLVGEAERRLLLEDWQGERVEFAHARCLHQLVEERAALHPDRAAVVYEGEELSFAQLNARANRLARRLRESGVGPDTLVGILMERGTGAVVALLGVLKAGGAYLPLDPSYPRERIAFMLEDADAPVLLTERHLLAGLPGLRAEVIALDSEREAVSLPGGENLQNVASPAALAYCIYTSGSTGRPKGVMIRHRSALNLLAALERAVYSRHPGATRVSVNAPLSFDASVKQVIQLALGRTLCVVPELARRDGGALRRYVREQAIDVLDCTPSQLRLMEAATGEAGAGGQTEASYPAVALVGGEAIDPRLWGRLSSDTLTAYYNVYGPTECTVDATCALVTAEHAAPTIGRPLSNVRALVLDARGQLAPVGVAGELCVGGEGVARGYLRRDELTKEKFIPDPFSDMPGARLYRTGDLARWSAGGVLEYLGRVDRQVKLRGYRIEPGEVEAAVASHPSVRECAVLAREDEPGDTRLVAYFVPRAGAAAAFVATGAGGDAAVAEGLREYVRGLLPEYMVPSAYVELARLPLTRHGKVDWQALPAPEAVEGVRRKGLRQPRTPVEEVLVELWRDVLRVRDVGVDENFFDLGGHSLLATQLVSRVREAFGVEVALRKLFEGPTIMKLGAHIEDLIVQQVEEIDEQDVERML
jgi:amino acid adenylation domain-containing protein